MSVTLESLAMNPETLQSARDVVERMAYFHWLDAGCPGDQALDCWLAAERDWIERFYVPSRKCELASPHSGPGASVRKSSCKCGCKHAVA